MAAIHLLSTRRVDSTPAQDKPYWLRDGGSLFLYVQANGSKLWRYRYRIDGKAQVYAIGKYPHITLQHARQERDRASMLVRQGIHPLHDKRSRMARQLESNQNTLQCVAERWMAFNTQWSHTYARQVRAVLGRDVFPVIGTLPITLIKAPHLRPILNAVADRGARTVAVLIRQWLGQLFAYAIVNDMCGDNPALHLKGLVRRAPARHHPPLKWTEIPHFLHRLNAWKGHRTTVIGLQLLALTFVRTVELRKARWSEIDLENALWSVPKGRMKMRRPHLVPLSRQAIALLKELHTLTGQGAVLFPNHRNPDDVIAVTTFNRAIGRLGYAGRFSAHGFRSTATTMLGLLGYSDKRVDLQLAHSRKEGSRAAYDHTQFLGSRAMIMQDWADILDALAQGNSLQQVTQKFGPMSARRTTLLKVIERE